MGMALMAVTFNKDQDMFLEIAQIEVKPGLETEFEAGVATIPNIPTIVEAGYPDVQGITFNGLFAPKATPPAVVEKLSAVIRASFEKKFVIDKLAELGSDARGSTPAEFTKFLEQESAKWADVMKQANIKVSE